MTSTEYRELIKRVDEIYASMYDETQPAFEDEDLESLRIIIRLTLEFADYLTHRQDGTPWRFAIASSDASYAAGSILSGLSFFYTLNPMYECLIGALPTTIDLETPESDLKSAFTSRYQQFLIETDFYKRCRLLLDMFRLQIIFAGYLYR